MKALKQFCEKNSGPVFPCQFISGLENGWTCQPNQIQPTRKMNEYKYYTSKNMACVLNYIFTAFPLSFWTFLNAIAPHVCERF